MPFSLKLSKRSKRYDVASKGCQSLAHLSSSAFVFKTDASPTMRTDLVANRVWIDHLGDTTSQGSVGVSGGGGRFSADHLEASSSSSLENTGAMVAQASSSNNALSTPGTTSIIINRAPILTPTLQRGNLGSNLTSEPRGLLSSSNLTLEEREALLPPYKPPPDYETFMRQKSSRHSMSLCNLPSYITSNSHNEPDLSTGNLNHFLAFKQANKDVSNGPPLLYRRDV